MRKSTIRALVIDDDRYFAAFVSNVLVDSFGFEVKQINSVDGALELVKTAKFQLVVLDLKMPPGIAFDAVETKGGHTTGSALAREIRKHLPDAKIILQTGTADSELPRPTPSTAGMAFAYKSKNPEDLVRTVRQVLGHAEQDVRIFIVHGHDHKTALEVKNFLQNRIGMPEPTILAEMPSHGRTLIEKFEYYASNADYAVVLLTPDDIGHPADSDTNARLRARQNVIFELGYFMCMMKRQSGRVLLLYNGPLEIPSDLSGIVYIDISGGVQGASELIRRELRVPSHPPYCI